MQMEKRFFCRERLVYRPLTQRKSPVFCESGILIQSSPPKVTHFTYYPGNETGLMDTQERSRVRLSSYL